MIEVSDVWKLHELGDEPLTLPLDLVVGGDLRPGRDPVSLRDAPGTAEHGQGGRTGL